MSTRITVDANNRFEFGGEKFVVDNAPHGRRESDQDAFTLVKGEAFINYYARLAGRFRPRTILELGIFQGGSYVLFDKLFAPEKMAALDITEEPVAPLVNYIRRTQNRTAHFGVSQTDAERIAKIVHDDLGGHLEMVIDDASHDYALTKRSFEILFPMLRPGGHYLIEDWAWAHAPAYQGATAGKADRPALTNIIFELVALLGSTSEIAEITVVKGVATVRKGATPTSDVDWGRILTRGKLLPQI